jgi:hypothetical protein
MGKKSFKIFKLTLPMLFIVVSFNMQAAVTNNAQKPTNQDLNTTKLQPIIHTKTVKEKPVKKLKAQSSSLGVFKLLIPQSLK